MTKPLNPNLQPSPSAPSSDSPNEETTQQTESADADPAAAAAAIDGHGDFNHNNNNNNPSQVDLEDWFVRILNEELEKFNDFYVDKEEDFVIRFQVGSLAFDPFFVFVFVFWISMPKCCCFVNCGLLRWIWRVICVV